MVIILVHYIAGGWPVTTDRNNQSLLLQSVYLFWSWTQTSANMTTFGATTTIYLFFLVTGTSIAKDVSQLCILFEIRIITLRSVNFSVK